MLELAERLLARLAPSDGDGVPLVVATVVAIDGSSPRVLGTSMAWDSRDAIGSIAGGCVEGATIEVADRVFDDGLARTVEFGVSDETALGVGLSCGGRLRIHLALIHPTDAVVDDLRKAAAGEAVGTLILLTGGDDTDPRLEAERSARIAVGLPGMVRLECAPNGEPGETIEAFIDVAVPPARMIIVGAMEYSSALAAAAIAVGYAVTVCDPRELFTTARRFPGCDLAIEWPPEYLARTAIDDRAVICLLSHDDRFDADALAIALRSPAAYVGAMGSRRTADRRRTALEELGLSAADIARLHAPIGLDLGASTPEETAVSILAEVIAARTDARRLPLTMTAGPIHQVAG